MKSEEKESPGTLKYVFEKEKHLLEYLLEIKPQRGGNFKRRKGNSKEDRQKRERK